MDESLDTNTETRVGVFEMLVFVKREGECRATVEDASSKLVDIFFFFAMLSDLQEFPQPGMEPASLAVKS